MVDNLGKGSDGCTGVPNGDFNHCCIEHDAYYEDNSISRLDADNKLFHCIREEGRGNIIDKALHLILASIYWLGVRLLGAKSYR